MTWEFIEKTVDAALTAIKQSAIKEAEFKSQLAAKDAQIAERDNTIAELTSKLGLTQSALDEANKQLDAEETDIAGLHDKLVELDGLLNPPAPVAV